MTSKSAKRLGLHKRGVLQEGNYADIVVFDYDAFEDKATYEEPLQYTAGVETVLVNGQIALDNGVETEVFSGRVLRHGGK